MNRVRRTSLGSRREMLTLPKIFRLTARRADAFMACGISPPICACPTRTKRARTGKEAVKN